MRSKSRCPKRVIQSSQGKLQAIDAARTGRGGKESGENERVPFPPRGAKAAGRVVRRTDCTDITKSEVCVRIKGNVKKLIACVILAGTEVKAIVVS